MFQLDPSVFGSLNSKADYDRQKQELNRQKQMEALQMSVLQRQAQPDPLGTEQLLAKAIQLGGVGNLSPQEQAQLQAADISQRVKQSVNPLTGEVISNRSYFDLMGMPPSQVMNMPTDVVTGRRGQGIVNEAGASQIPTMRNDTGSISPNMQTVPNTGSFVDVASMPDLPMDGLPQDLIDPMQVNVPNTAGMSPRTRQTAEEETVKTNLSLQAEQAKSQLKTQEGQVKINTLIQQLKRVNNELAQMGGLKSAESTIGNLPTMAAGASPFGVNIGSGVEGVVSPQVAQKREEFNSILKSLLPFYIAANNLPATMVDTEQGMERIMQSMGNPYGFAETNQKLLENAGKLFGGQQPQQKQRRVFNPATGRLE
jgi:hypothetical protein